MGPHRRRSSVVIGVTDHAQEALGDVVYVELPKVGDTPDRREVLRRDRVHQGGE